MKAKLIITLDIPEQEPGMEQTSRDILENIKVEIQDTIFMYGNGEIDWTMEDVRA